MGSKIIMILALMELEESRQVSNNMCCERGSDRYLGYTQWGIGYVTCVIRRAYRMGGYSHSSTRPGGLGPMRFPPGSMQ